MGEMTATITTLNRSELVHMRRTRKKAMISDQMLIENYSITAKYTNYFRRNFSCRGESRLHNTEIFLNCKLYRV